MVVAVVMGIVLFFSPIIFYVSYNLQVNSKIHLFRVSYINQSISSNTEIT